LKAQEFHGRCDDRSNTFTLTVIVILDTKLASSAASFDRTPTEMIVPMQITVRRIVFSQSEIATIEAISDNATDI
jgi:hypothetical protein